MSSMSYLHGYICLTAFVCQEENKILDKMHRQKVAEVEKLTQTVRELEEAVLAGGAAANAVRDYQRKVQEMNVIQESLGLDSILVYKHSFSTHAVNHTQNWIYLVMYFSGGEKNS